jgi:hypothetical protein
MTVLPSTLAPHAATMYEYLGGITAPDAAHGYPIAWLLDAIAWPVEVAAAIGLDPLVLFDPARCPAESVAWLAQFFGINPEGQSVASLRLQIPAPEGFDRGTDDAIASAANRTLTGGATATVLGAWTPENPGVRSWGHLTVYVPPLHCPDPEVTERAIRRVKCRWDKLWFIVGTRWMDEAARHPTWSAAATAHPTWSDFAKGHA